MSHTENFIKTESSLSAVHSWKNLHGCLAELDGMMLKAQLFIVAPAKKLWPWQNSAGGFGLDLVCSQQKTTMRKRFLRELKWCHYYSSILSSKSIGHKPLVCDRSWFVRTQTLHIFVATYLHHKIFWYAMQYQADEKLTFYGWNDSFFCFERLNQQFFAAMDMNFPISFLPGGEHLIVPCCALAPGLWLTAR